MNMSSYIDLASMSGYLYNINCKIGGARAPASTDWFITIMIML
jgi:hypothetical protein